MPDSLSIALRHAARAETRGEDIASVVELLLASGADPHEIDENGETAFNVAAANNSPVTGRLMTLHWLGQALAGEGPKGLHDASGAHGSTLAQYMAKWLHDDELEKYIAAGLAQGLKIDVPNASGWTPLSAAAAMGRVAAVKAFLPHYSRSALCIQTTQEYKTAYNGHDVAYRKGLNAIEIAQERVFQDEGLTEELGERLWECMDLIVAALAGKPSGP